MTHLTRNDYAGALRLLTQLEAECCSPERFARAAVSGLGEWVASELCTLSVCDLVSGHRQVVGLPDARLGSEDIACFDRHFFAHPLVRHHGIDGGRATHRISDALGRREFHRTALYADHYRRVGLEHAIAVPLFFDGRTLVSIVLNRRGLDFSERDRERLDLLRPHLAFLYRLACRADAPRRDGGALPVAAAARSLVAPGPLVPDAPPPGLTPREGDVMHWLSRGKTDAEIAALLAISPRTVHKHLEHVYVKLGVETRTAAVMRTLAMRRPDGCAEAEGIGFVSRAVRAVPAGCAPR